MHNELTEELWKQFFDGNRLACARLISIVENCPDQTPAVINRLACHGKSAVRVGITGPPGVGKSTITSALAKNASSKGLNVGIIAVDPSSPFTGGAFLGDRIRMQNLTGDDNVFIRSLASRSGGGLSPSTPYVADVFDAFGMDMILIETVGVGQAELDVLLCTDLIVLVLQPSTGDIIQMLKAGIMETADLFVVNKSDLPGADQLVETITFILESCSLNKSSSRPPVLKASAENNAGIDEVFASLRFRITELNKTGLIQERRQDRFRRDTEQQIKEILWKRFMLLPKMPEILEEKTVSCRNSAHSPFVVSEELASRIDVTLTKPDDSTGRDTGH